MAVGAMRDLWKICQSFESCHASFGGRTGCGQGPVRGLLGGREFGAWRAAIGGGAPVARHR